MLITYQPKLLYKKLVAPHIYHLKFTYPEKPEWTFNAGQYMIFHVPQEGTHPARRLYSICSAPSQKESLDFVIEIIPNGIGSAFIEALPVGETATLQGPAGVFTYRDTGRNSVFLATGTGIAPMHSMIQELLSSNVQNPKSKLYLFWGLKTCDDAYLTEELTTLAKSDTLLYFRACLSRMEKMEDVRADLSEFAILGRVTNGLEELANTDKLSIADCDYYLCGSKHVVESLREYLAEKGVPKEQIFFEKFT